MIFLKVNPQVGEPNALINVARINALEADGHGGTMIGVGGIVYADKRSPEVIAGRIARLTARKEKHDADI